MMSEFDNDKRTDDDVDTDILDAVEEEGGKPSGGDGKGGKQQSPGGGGRRSERYCSMCHRPESQTSGESSSTRRPAS